jgi:hypothetical protein
MSPDAPSAIVLGGAPSCIREDDICCLRARTPLDASSRPRGVPFIVMECFDVDSMLDNIERHRCTWMLGFPYEYAALLEAPRRGRETCLPCASVRPELMCVRPIFRSGFCQRSAHRFITSGEPRRLLALADLRLGKRTGSGLWRERRSGWSMTPVLTFRVARSASS